MGIEAERTPWEVSPMDVGTDLDAVLAIDARSFARPWSRADYRRELARPETALVLVVRAQGGRTVGYCATWVVADELQINSLAVAPEWRGRGAARALLGHVLAAAGDRGAARATLEVRASNVAARALYESAGFRVAAVRPAYYTEPVDDALIMWKTLP